MKQILNQSLILILLSVVGMGATWLFHPNPPPWDPMAIEEGEITLEDALEIENVQWLDARAVSAYEAAHIPGALNLNEDNWDQHFESFIQVWDGESTLVVYCDSRVCAASHTVAERLKADLGVENVFVLKGGWQTWLSHKI